MKKIVCGTVLVFLFAVFVLPVSFVMAAGQDEGLYPPVPPENAAFVRVIDAQNSDHVDLIPKVNGRALDGTRFGDIKPYAVAMSGNVKVDFGGQTLEFNTEAKGHYTVILQNDTLRFVKDPELQDPLKAQIVVYNLSTHDDVSLKTADGKVTVVGPIKAGEVLDRAVNPIKVTFAIFAGEDKFADVSDVPLERKANYVIAVMDSGDAGVATFLRSLVSDGK